MCSKCPLILMLWIFCLVISGGVYAQGVDLKARTGIVQVGKGQVILTDIDSPRCKKYVEKEAMYRKGNALTFGCWETDFGGGHNSYARVRWDNGELSIFDFSQIQWRR